MPTRVVRKKTRVSRKRSKAFALRSAWLRLRTRLQVPDLRGSRALAALILVAMCMLLGWFWLDLSFYVYAADVEAAPGTSEDQLFRAAGLDGLNIFFVSERQIRERVEEVAPGAVDVQVLCALPNRVRLVVSERPGQVAWRTSQATYLIDADGKVLRRDDGSSGSCPHVVALDDDPVEVGGQVDTSAVSGAIELRRLLPGVAEFEYSKSTGLVVTDARGWRIYFGDGQLLAEKVASMRVLVDKIVKTGASARVIDVRFLGSAYYR